MFYFESFESNVSTISLCSSKPKNMIFRERSGNGADESEQQDGATQLT